MRFLDNSIKTNWKFIAIVVVLGLVVGGGIVWYANSPTPAPQPIQISNIQKPTPEQTVDTSTWQTYRNEEFGFEMQIPKEWKPFQERQRDDRVLGLTLNEIPNQPFGDNLLFSLSVEVADDQKNIAEWFRRKEFSEANMKEFFDIANETYGEGFVSMADFSILIEDTQIGGFPAKVQTIRCLKSDCYFMGGPQDRKEYYVKRNGMAFTIMVITSGPNMYFTLLDQILSTFRFVE